MFRTFVQLEVLTDNCHPNDFEENFEVFAKPTTHYVYIVPLNIYEVLILKLHSMHKCYINSLYTLQMFRYICQIEMSQNLNQMTHLR